MRTLIIGAQGLVGSALKRHIPDAIEGVLVIKKPNQVYTDITKYETLLNVFSNFRPKIVYLPAAITNVDKCEDAGTNVVNVRGAITVLRLCEQFEAKLVYFSSSYVFDGKSKFPYSPQQETHPLCNYGVQKDTVEKQILKSDLKHLIIRTVGVFGQERRKKNFAKSVLSSLFAGKEVFVPSDQYMNPILSDDLAQITIKLADKHSGIFHVAGDRCLSKTDFAMKLASYFYTSGGFNHSNQIKSVPTSEMNQKALRPKMGCLDCSQLTEVGLSVPSFDGGITKFLAQEYNG